MSGTNQVGGEALRIPSGDKPQESGISDLITRIGTTAERVGSMEAVLRGKTDVLIGGEEVDKIQSEPAASKHYGNGLIRDLVDTVESLEARVRSLYREVQRYEESTAF